MGNDDLFPQLDRYDRELLIELLTEHRDGVLGGDVSGYADTRDGRLAHVAELLQKLGGCS